MDWGILHILTYTQPGPFSSCRAHNRSRETAIPTGKLLYWVGSSFLSCKLLKDADFISFIPKNVSDLASCR